MIIQVSKTRVKAIDILPASVIVVLTSYQILYIVYPRLSMIDRAIGTPFYTAKELIFKIENFKIQPL